MPKKVVCYRYTPVSDKFETFNSMYLRTDTSSKSVSYYLEDIDHHHFACSGKEGEAYTTGDLANGGYVVVWLETPNKKAGAVTISLAAFDILDQARKLYASELERIEAMQENTYNMTWMQDE